MGTTASQFGEWIEFYNDGSDTVDLSGWQLFEGGGSVKVIDLVGTIAPGGYHVIERITASVPDPVPGITNTAGAFGGGGLSNTSEHLVLKDGAGTVQADINATGGWPAGSSDTKETMQWSEGAWITAAATPGAVNAIGTTTPEDDGNNPPPDDETPDSAGGGSSAGFESVASFTVTIGKKQTVPVGTPLDFSAKLSRKSLNTQAKISWSFGDGASAQGLTAAHTYLFPGEYIVTATAEAGGIKALAKSEVLIIKPEFAIAHIEYQDPQYVELKNRSKYDVDVSGWQLRTASTTFFFPPGTYLKKEGETIIPSSVTLLTLDPQSTLSFINRSGTLAAERFVSTTPSSRLAASTSQELLTKAKALQEDIYRLAAAKERSKQESYVAVPMPTDDPLASSAVPQSLPVAAVAASRVELKHSSGLFHRAAGFFYEIFH